MPVNTYINPINALTPNPETVFTTSVFHNVT